MGKILTGKVVSVGMQNTVVVEIIRKTPHPLYRKLLTRGKKYKVETNGKTVVVGQEVQIKETRPIAKDKHFMLVEKN